MLEGGKRLGGSRWSVKLLKHASTVSSLQRHVDDGLRLCHFEVWIFPSFLPPDIQPIFNRYGMINFPSK